jgi:hypothetical protein
MRLSYLFNIVLGVIILLSFESFLLTQYGKQSALAQKNQSSSTPLKEWRLKGKTQYKNQDFRGAQKTFIKLVQHNSNSSTDYLLLARSANRAEDYLVASVAYQIYFELAKRKADRRAKDEREEVQKHVEGGVDKRKRKAHKARLEEVLKLIKKDELFGDQGALLALFDIHREGIFDPLLARAHKQFSKTLLRNKELRLRRALTGEANAKELEQFAKALDRWGHSSWGNAKLAQREILALNTFATLKATPKQSLEQIGVMTKERYNVPKPLLRSAQFIALMHLDRNREVFLMADGLIRSLEGRSFGEEEANKINPQIKLYNSIKGIYGRVLGKKEADEALIKALFISSPSLSSRLKVFKNRPQR